MKFNCDGSHLLVQTRTDTDSKGKSYYGESSLHFLKTDGSYKCQVPSGEALSVILGEHCHVF